MKSWSFQTKLVTAFMLLITVVLAAVFWSSSLYIQDRMLVEKQQDLTAKGTEVARKIAASRESSATRINLGEILSDMDLLLNSRIWVLDADRQPIGYSLGTPLGNSLRSPNGRTNSPGRNPAGSGNTSISSNVQRALRSLSEELDAVYRGENWSKVLEHPLYEERMLVIGVPILLANGKVDGAVVINSPIVAVATFMRHIYWFIGIGALAGLLFSFIVIQLLTRSLVRPLRAMQATTSAIATGDYSARVPVDGTDEIGQLGSSINHLAEDLGRFMLEIAKTEKLRKDFIANVSHELHTPLTVIRGFTEAILDGTVESRDKIMRYTRLVCDESIRLERLIHSLLDLSKLQSASANCPLELVDMADVVEHVQQLILPLAASKPLTLRTEIPQGLPMILGNRDRLIQLLLIFLDNAVKYTHAGGTATLSLSKKETGALRCAIQDTGVGIKAEDMPYIWERFYKADKSHQRTDGSTGLGLAIARQIIDLHHATVAIASEAGKGTRIQLDFPPL